LFLIPHPEFRSSRRLRGAEAWLLKPFGCLQLRSSS
jgi:hypothetical protein